MEPCEARAVFPSFDEPDLRAKFNIRLIRPNENFITASNSEQIIRGSTNPLEDVYEETVEMSTYLVAFVVGELQFSEKFDRFRILARPDDIANNKHKYALEISDKIIKLMEEYLDVPYTLTKLDQVSIPSGYFSGAMENWGLAIYDERSLILSSPELKPGIAEIVTHELAHQWFGNLVGPLWWKYIWLNEGFASYFQKLIAPQVEPSIDSRQLFVIDLVQSTFQLDALSYTIPILQHAETPSEIGFVFNNIVYNKGGAVVRMMEMFLTTTVFRQGISYYVKDMQFRSASTDDLYRNLQKAVDESSLSVLPNSLNVFDIMSTWVSLPGFPVVNVLRNYSTTSNNVKLVQRKYVENNPIGDLSEWKIAINFATNSNPNFENTAPDAWLTESEEFITVPALHDNDWLIANKRETGYYRVNYDVDNWNLIIQTLLSDHLQIDVLNRAQLIDDSLNLARTGRLDYDIANELVEYLENEEDRIPWLSYQIAQRQLEKMFYYSSAHALFKKYVLRVTNGIYQHLGFDKIESDRSYDEASRQEILNFLCRMGHADCLSESLNKFKEWRAGRLQIPSHIQQVIFCGAIRGGGQDNFEYLYNLLQITSPSQHLQLPIIEGLSCSGSVENLKKILKLELNVPTDKVLKLVYDSGANGLIAAIDYLEENFINVEERLGKRSRIVLNEIGGLISTRHQHKQLQQLLLKTNRAHVYSTAIVHAEENIKWRMKNLQAVINKLLKKM